MAIIQQLQFSRGYQFYPLVVESWMIYIGTALYLCNVYQVILFITNRFYALLVPKYYSLICGLLPTTAFLLLIYLSEVYILLTQTHRPVISSTVCYLFYLPQYFMWATVYDPYCYQALSGKRELAWTFITMILVCIPILLRLIVFYCVRNCSAERFSVFFFIFSRVTNQWTRKRRSGLGKTRFCSSRQFFRLCSSWSTRFSLYNWSEFQTKGLKCWYSSLTPDTQRFLLFLFATLLRECMHSLDGLVWNGKPHPISRFQIHNADVQPLLQEPHLTDVLSEHNSPSREQCSNAPFLYFFDQLSYPALSHFDSNVLLYWDYHLCHREFCEI